jgi:putative transcriptional regulator
MISFEPLRRILKERGISSYYLRNKCGRDNLDSKTIQRLMNDESVSTNTLNALCSILDCEISEIIEFIPDTREDGSSEI